MSRIFVSSTANVNFPWSAVDDAVFVVNVILSAVLFEAPFKTEITSASVADVPMEKDTSALFASSYKVKSPPVRVVIACDVSTLNVVLVRSSPVPAVYVVPADASTYALTDCCVGTFVAELDAISSSSTKSVIVIVPSERLPN